MEKGKYTDIMVETVKTFDLDVDLRSAMDLFVRVNGCPQHAVGIAVSEEDVKVILRRDNTQYNYIVETPTECGAGTQYDIHDAVAEIFEVAGIRNGGASGFTTEHTDVISLSGNGSEEGEFDGAICATTEELREELEDILSYRVIDWS